MPEKIFNIYKWLIRVKLVDKMQIWSPKLIQARREEWISTIDPQTAPGRRSELIGVFRQDIADAETAGLSLRTGSFYKGIARLPSGVIVASVMTSAYVHGINVFTELKRAGKATEIVRLGHSTHSFSGWKYFSDGTAFESNALYVLSGDIQLLRASPNAPIVLVDNVILSGITLARIVRTLREQGHAGELWIYEGSGRPTPVILADRHRIVGRAIKHARPLEVKTEQAKQEQAPRVVP